MSRKNIIILITIIGAIALGYYFLNYQPQKEEIRQMEAERAESEKLEVKIKEALDPNAQLDRETCVVGRNLPVTGVVSKKEKDSLSVKPVKGEEITVKLLPKTLFIKINLSAEREQISQKEISWNDVKEGDSVVVAAFCKEEKPDEYLALLVKILTYQK
jgi:hypothetical protein